MVYAFDSKFGDSEFGDSEFGDSEIGQSERGAAIETAATATETATPVPHVESERTPNTKDTILEVASRRFAMHGYAGTSLTEIAEEVGIRRPSLLHHFPSKETLYRAVLLQSFAEWAALVDQAIGEPREGWSQVERVLRAAFRFFEERPDFVRLVRWEALEGGPFLRDELTLLLRPLFERGAAFLQREMEAGRLRRYDARQLLLTGYGAVLSYLSDGQLMSVFLDTDPLSPGALAVRREHVIDVLRAAVAI